MRRGTTGTSPQHRIKSSIRYMDNLRISDDRALKVAGAHPGRPHASRFVVCLNYRNRGKPVYHKPPALIGPHVSTISEPTPEKGRRTQNRRREDIQQVE